MFVCNRSFQKMAHVLIQTALLWHVHTYSIKPVYIYYTLLKRQLNPVTSVIPHQNTIRPAYICYVILNYNQVRLHLIHVTKIQPGHTLSKYYQAHIHMLCFMKTIESACLCFHTTKGNPLTSVIPNENTTRPTYTCNAISKYNVQ